MSEQTLQHPERVVNLPAPVVREEIYGVVEAENALVQLLAGVRRVNSMNGSAVLADAESIVLLRDISVVVQLLETVEAAFPERLEDAVMYAVAALPEAVFHAPESLEVVEVVMDEA